MSEPDCPKSASVNVRLSPPLIDAVKGPHRSNGDNRGYDPVRSG
jgi:hypothetical protein